MHVASSRDTCRLKTWGLAYLKMNFHPRIMLIYAFLSLKCRKSYLRAIKTSICPSFRPSKARIFVKKAPVFRSSFSKYGPVWRIGHTAERPEMIYMVTGQESFSTIFTNNSNRPRRSWREDVFLGCELRKENFYNRTLALTSRSTLTWESKVSYAKANVLGLGDCRFMSIRKHCKPVGTNKDPKSKKFPVYRPGP